MSEALTMFDDQWATLELDDELYPKDAIHGAAYVLIDRCYLHLDRAAPGRTRIRLRDKAGDREATRLWLGEMENELLAQAYRRRLATENRVLIEAVTSRAIAGAAGPPGLDELLAMEIDESTAFEDPLGIAMSWEDKYAKKKDKSANAEPAAPTAVAPAEPSEAAPEAASPPKDEG
jgi:His-Xaa-Ser system protein HxsD